VAEIVPSRTSVKDGAKLERPTTKSGRDADGIAKTESDHFMKCPGCGQRFDMRDLG
jgi:hypothetical protein